MLLAVPRPAASALPAKPPVSADTAPVFDDDSLYDLLWQVTAYVQLMVEAGLADTPLTMPSASMLIHVRDEPGISVAEFSRRIPKTQQTISSVAARLEKLGLIERRLRSGRGVGLYVTGAGAEMAQLAAAREQQFVTKLGELLGEQRSAALTRLLRESRAILREAR